MKEDTFKSDDEHDFKRSGLSTTRGRANIGIYVKKRQCGNRTYLTLMLLSFFFGKIREF